MTRRFGHGELHLALLALLSERPMHGYDLMGELARRMGGRYRPSPGSIYPAVSALQAEGLIAGREEDDRRVYRITAMGSKALAGRADRLARMEAQLGVRFGEDSVDVALARFTQRVRTLAGKLDARSVSEVLERTAETLGSMATKEEDR